MSREKFYKYLKDLFPYIGLDLISPNEISIAVDRKLSILLYFLKNAESRRMTANTFGNPLSTVSNQSMKFVKQLVRI